MFHSARLKLTVWYSVIVLVVVVFFSVAMYGLLTQEVERFARIQRFRIERHYHIDTPSGQIELSAPDPNQPFMDPDLVDETRHRIAVMLAAIDTTLVLLSGGIGYFLAGKTLRPIRTMMEDQNQFIADASHELRTPLTALKSAMEVNARDPDLTVSQAKTLITDSLGEVNKLQALSDGLLQSIQYQKPNGNTPAASFALTPVIKQAVRSLQSVAKEKEVSLQTSTEPVDIYGYQHGIADLLRILLDNAIKYSISKSTIVITSKKADTSATITVADEGIGIEAKDLPHIFDRFYRADSARSKNAVSGYGLGLSIAKRIVAIHQGTLSVSSAVGKGTTFTIRLPRRKKSRIK